MPVAHLQLTGDFFLCGDWGRYKVLQGFSPHLQTRALGIIVRLIGTGCDYKGGLLLQATFFWGTMKGAFEARLIVRQQQILHVNNTNIRVTLVNQRVAAVATTGKNDGNLGDSVVCTCPWVFQILG